MRRHLLILALILNTASLVTAQNGTRLVPTGKGWAVKVPVRGQESAPDLANNRGGTVAGYVHSGNGIIYHGGPVMHGSPVHVYFIWYGNWTTGPTASDRPETVALVDTLFAPTRGMGASPYFRITTTYGDTTGNASGNLGEVASIRNNYSRGKNLADADVRTIVTNAIGEGIPRDSNGIYFVLTSSDVAESSGFCKLYCGWHNHTNLDGTDIKYAFVGNPARCPYACEAQSLSPNGDSGADAMVSIMAHEAVETVTDPDLNAWYDSQGNEVADKCAWKFGPYKTLAGHGAYNETFGTYNWLLQMQWENTRGGGCDQALGGKFYTK